MKIYPIKPLINKKLPQKTSLKDTIIVSAYIASPIFIYETARRIIKKQDAKTIQKVFYA